MGGATEGAKQGDGLGVDAVGRGKQSGEVFKDVLGGTELTRKQPAKE